MRVTAPVRTILDVADASGEPSTIEGAVTHALERGLATAEELTQRGDGRGQRVSGLITRALGLQPATSSGDNGQKASSLGGRRGRSGYRYQDLVVAEWYATLLHKDALRTVRRSRKSFPGPRKY